MVLRQCQQDSRPFARLQVPWHLRHITPETECILLPQEIFTPPVLFGLSYSHLDSCPSQKPITLDPSLGPPPTFRWPPCPIQAALSFFIPFIHLLCLHASLWPGCSQVRLLHGHCKLHTAPDGFLRESDHLHLKPSKDSVLPVE